MIEELVKKYSLVSDQIDARELRVILRSLAHVLQQNVPGDVVELGCYSGTTSLFLQRMLQAQATPSQLHVYDSFAGLPAKTSPDNSPSGEQFKAGELAVSKAQFIKHFRQAGLPLPHIHKAWFADLTTADMPEHIAFAFLDGDFYESIRDSLRIITPHLAPGAMIVVDDYQAEALPGAARAVDEWLQGKPYTMRSEASLAVITTA